VSAGFDTEIAVVGAGVIGLAVAAELAESGRTVMVLERQPGPGRETSSRNSEVIHAGLYYPTGSLKARLCVEGRRLLYDFCARHGIGHRRIGKLVIACTAAELPELESLHALGVANGVEGLELLEGRAVGRLEPEVRAVAALSSPETGIVDSHGLVKALEARLGAGGGLTLYQCELLGVTGLRPGFQLRLRNPSGEETLRCRVLVNAAGLEADSVAAMAGCVTAPLHWCKGDYFGVGGASRHLVARLIYPVPQPEFLGIHVTLDLAGRMRLGPDATYVDRAQGQQVHLAVDERKAEIFAVAVQRYLPRLAIEDLQPEMAGLRAKLQGPGCSFRDFLVQAEPDPHLPGLVNLLGMESPGLTSSLAVGKLVARIVLDCT